jgi:putative ABC transport system permease protein
MMPVTRFAERVSAASASVAEHRHAGRQSSCFTTRRSTRPSRRCASCAELKPEQENDFELYSNESLISSFAKVADAVAAGSFVISGIALLAAGVGIMNIMLVSVTERTKEIGIRKSIGARKKNILTQFLIEAVAISLAGGVMGIILGIGVGNLVAVMLKAALVFPWDWAAIGLVVCSGIGVGFGFYPAWKAASLDPIEALRYE